MNVPISQKIAERECPFCDYEGPSRILKEWAVNGEGASSVYVIEPLRQVTPGHVLVVPSDHVIDFAASPEITARVMKRAAEWWRIADTTGDCNLITSKGKAASQTVAHFHVHVVPRHAGDGLWLPWSNPNSGHELADQRAARERARRELEPGWSPADLPVQKATPLEGSSFMPGHEFGDD